MNTLKNNPSFSFWSFENGFRKTKRGKIGAGRTAGAAGFLPKGTVFWRVRDQIPGLSRVLSFIYFSNTSSNDLHDHPQCAKGQIFPIQKTQPFLAIRNGNSIWVRTLRFFFVTFTNAFFFPQKGLHYKESIFWTTGPFPRLDKLAKGGQSTRSPNHNSTSDRKVECVSSHTKVFLITYVSIVLM